jgi:uncharacterized BrkB/YihY/UPF0761 family membrane protein
VIVLLWFYALAIVVLAGAIANALRFELHQTGRLRAIPREDDASSGTGNLGTPQPDA